MRAYDSSYSFEGKETFELSDTRNKSVSPDYRTLGILLFWDSVGERTFAFFRASIGIARNFPKQRDAINKSSRKYYINDSVRD